jgi:hypothetical protein
VPRRTTSTSCAALLAAAALALAGCGGSSGAKTASTPAPKQPAGPAHPHISSPANGDVIPATAELGETRGAKIKVTGTAQPGHTIVVSGGCQVAGCSKRTIVDAQGKFEAQVSATTSAANHTVTVIASYEVADAVDSDRVIVTLGAMGSPSASGSHPHRKHHHAHAAATPFPAVTVAPPSSTPAPQGTAVPTVSGSGRAGTVVVIGDSLAQGMQPYMPGALPGWKVSVDARIGRPLAEGMQIFNSASVKPGAVYAFSLFTNDDPRSVAALDAAVRQSVQRAGCAVWATIVRPPVGGVSYNAANQRLHQLAAALAPRMQLVDWAAAVAAHPDWVPGADHVHASATGYQNRAALYAQAIRNCPG